MALTDDDKIKLLRTLNLTVFLTATGLGTVTFLLPVYASILGANYVDLGLIGLSRNLIYTVATLTLGYLLDRFERVKIYLGFMVVGALVVVLFGAMRQVALLIAWSALAGLVSASFWVSAETMTADISPPERLSQSMSNYNISWILGFIVGPYIGGLISDAFGWLTLFVSLSALIIISVTIVYFRIRPSIQLRNKTGSMGFNLAPLRPLMLAYAVLLPFSTILGIYMAIVPGYLKDIGLASALVGFLITMTNGVRGIGFLNSKRFVTLGVKKSIIISSLLLFSGMLIFSFAGSVVGYAISLAMYGFASGIMTPLMMNYIAANCDRSALGSAMGMHEGIYGLGMLLGPAIGGAIAENYSPAILYRLLAVLALTMLPLAWMLAKSERNMTLFTIIRPI